MPDTSVQSFYLDGWPGGWQPDMQETQLAADTVVDLLNVVWTEGHGLRKRGGLDKFTIDIAGMEYPPQVTAPKVFTASGLHPNFTQQVHYWVQSDGLLFTQSLGNLLAQDQFGGGADLVSSTHALGPWITVGGQNYFRTHAIATLTFGDTIYSTCLRFGGHINDVFTNATQNGASSGASLAIAYDVQAGTFTRPIVHPLDGTSTGYVRARTAISKYERVFAANVHSQGTYRYPSRVYWSNSLTAETFETNSFIDVGLDDGTEVVRIIGFGEQILIFKNTSVWALVGTDEDTFSLFQLDDNLGCEASDAVVSDAGLLYFFDFRTGVWAYNGADFSLISKEITEELFADFNREAGFKAIMGLNDRKLYLSIPVGDFAVDHTDHPQRTYVLDLDLQVWTRYDYGFTGFFEYFTDYNASAIGVAATGAPLMSGVDNATTTNHVGLYEAESLNYVDDGVLYDSYWETTWLNPGDVGDRHRLRKLEILVAADSSDLTVEVYRDLGTGVWQTATLAKSGVIDEFHWKQVEFDQGMWDWLKLRIRQNLFGVPWQVNGLGINFSDRPNPRGNYYSDGRPT